MIENFRMILQKQNNAEMKKLTWLKKPSRTHLIMINDFGINILLRLLTGCDMQLF